MLQQTSRSLNAALGWKFAFEFVLAWHLIGPTTVSMLILDLNLGRHVNVVQFKFAQAATFELAVQLLLVELLEVIELLLVVVKLLAVVKLVELIAVELIGVEFAVFKLVVRLKLNL